MTPRPAIARAVRLAAAAVFACAVLAYGIALAGDYVFDDLHSVSCNPALQELGNVASYWWDPAAFSAGAGKMYRPALLTSFALNLALAPAAWSLKAGNVLLHAGVATLLFAWLWRLSRRLRASTAAALLFAAHPLASEAINLVSARSELLAAFGMLLALHAHLSWRRGGDGARAVVGMVCGCVLACGSKETGVVLPVVAAAQELWSRHAPWSRGAWRGAFVRVLPLLAVVAVYLVARRLLLGEVAVALVGREGGDPLSGAGRTLTMHLATMGAALPGAALQMVLPWRLSIDPAVEFHDSLQAPASLAGWGTMLAVTAWAMWPGPSARLRRLGAALAWCVAMPWIVVPLNMPLAEHRFYAPLLGAAAIAVAAAPRAWRLVVAPSRIVRRIAPAALGVLLLVAATASAQRSWLYRDELAMWRAELAHHPQSFRAWWGVGTCLFRGGDPAAALAPLATAHELDPRHSDALRNYAEALVAVPDAKAEPERALAVAAEYAARSPRDPWARTLQAQAHLQAGRVRGGREHFEQAEDLALSCLKIATPKGYVYRLAAKARRGLGDLEGALAHLDTSIARGLRATEVRLDRAAVLRDLGRARDAQRELLTAQREAPGDAAVMQALMQLAAPPR